MTGRRTFLVIGGDSFVGGEVARVLWRRGHQVFSTTRRPNTIDVARIFLDFADAETFVPPDGIEHAFVIAAATNYERCESDPLARTINVALIPNLVGSLLQKGVSVSFISTNAVFGGEQPWPTEDAPHHPQIAYARQKAAGEAAIRQVTDQLIASDRLSIVRLTKVLSAAVPPLPGWLASWRRGEPVEPFADLIFAPMSLGFVAQALATIGEKRTCGNLHLSGAENVSYVDFAHALARRLGVDTLLIRPSTAVAKGVNILFKPSYSGLGMARTTQLTGVQPQSLRQVVEDMAAELAA